MWNLVIKDYFYKSIIVGFSGHQNLSPTNCTHLSEINIKTHTIATVALNPLVVFLQTTSLAKTGYCPAGEVKYSFHVHNEGIGGVSDSLRTGFIHKK